MINPEIQAYVEESILPQYRGFDKAHNLAHGEKVIHNSMAIAADYDVDSDMVYVIAAYHDIGLAHGRAEHEKNSGMALRADRRLQAWFTPEQITLMAEAVEDHRASNECPPCSLYGRIVSEADRDIDCMTILTRTIQYGLAHYPEYDSAEHYRRTQEHMQEKYGVGGYLKLWLETEENTRNLQELHALLADEERFRAEFARIFRSEQEKFATGA